MDGKKKKEGQKKKEKRKGYYLSVQHICSSSLYEQLTVSYHLKFTILHRYALCVL